MFDIAYYPAARYCLNRQASLKTGKKFVSNVSSCDQLGLNVKSHFVLNARPMT